MEPSERIVGEGDERVVELARIEGRHRLATDLVLAVFRLMRACQLHSSSNAAVLSLVNFAGQVLGDYCARADVQAATITFTAATVFVDGKQLRAKREAYASALELGALLERCGVSEITLPATVDRTHIGAFARVLADALRGPSRADLSAVDFGGIRMRKVTIDLGALGRDESPADRTLRAYAAAVVVVRRFVSRLTKFPTHLPSQLRRVAQKLVSEFDDDPRMLIAAATSGAAGSDEAALSVSSSVVALAAARQVVSDRVVLANLVMASMLYGVGRIVLSAGGEDGASRSVARGLSAAETRSLPEETARALVALGRIHAPNILRTAVVYEALWLRYGGQAGALYGGRRSASVLARILAVAREFADTLAAPSGGRIVPVGEAIEALEAKVGDATERMYVKLLVGALGIFPVGTPVELTTGEVGVVMDLPTRPMDFARPRVRLIQDSKGAVLAIPYELDLATPEVGGISRMIRRPIEAGDEQIKSMRSYVLSLTSRARGTASRPQGETPPGPVQAPTAPGVPQAPPDVEMPDSRGWETPSPSNVASARVPDSHARPTPKPPRKSLVSAPRDSGPSPGPEQGGAKDLVAPSPRVPRVPRIPSPARDAMRPPLMGDAREPTTEIRTVTAAVTQAVAAAQRSPVEAIPSAIKIREPFQPAAPTMRAVEAPKTSETVASGAVSADADLGDVMHGVITGDENQQRLQESRVTPGRKDLGSASKTETLSASWAEYERRLGASPDVASRPDTPTGADPTNPLTWAEYEQRLGASPTNATRNEPPIAAGATQDDRTKHLGETPEATSATPSQQREISSLLQEYLDAEDPDSKR